MRIRTIYIHMEQPTVYLHHASVGIPQLPFYTLHWGMLDVQQAQVPTEVLFIYFC